ncbi:hypothetical protein BS50DRAFT_401800 [Corynespora cassiicola Philippines]|uniref:Uncharacterized protein n=1 Tax=Corynespora cassiicola Philippines TaxID=1448308 RepID=A0A2T2NKH7_CORCC|nr:hypothetical protein BS50DRAFT_401800 [Corynespora cassiicola Philippines]
METASARSHTAAPPLLLACCIVFASSVFFLVLHCSSRFISFVPLDFPCSLALSLSLALALSLRLVEAEIPASLEPAGIVFFVSSFPRAHGWRFWACSIFQ